LHTFAQIRSKSGLALHSDIEVGAGIIDSDYMGEWGVVLRNFGNAEVVLQEGVAIAQVLFQPLIKEDIDEEDDQDNVRGCKGFGEMTNKKLKPC
jgi:dUTP pyrophosphatase